MIIKNRSGSFQFSVNRHLFISTAIVKKQKVKQTVMKTDWIGKYC